MISGMDGVVQSRDLKWQWHDSLGIHELPGFLKLS